MDEYSTMKRKKCKLDDKSMFTVELEKVNGKTFITIVDKKSTHEDMPYKSFTNLCSYVDNYRLLELADFIYDYCNNK